MLALLEYVLSCFQLSINSLTLGVSEVPGVERKAVIIPPTCCVREQNVDFVDLPASLTYRYSGEEERKWAE